jgi:large subunit ribosomal protein L1
MLSLFTKSISSFSKVSKKSSPASKKKIEEIVYNPYQGLRLIRAQSLANFNESVIVQLKLNVDPRHGDQLVRGTCRMPFSLGSSKRLAIITSDPLLASSCLSSGADLILDPTMIDSIRTGGPVLFDSLLATPESLSLLKPAARFLGPMGLMPNLKLGTVVPTDQL